MIYFWHFCIKHCCGRGGLLRTYVTNIYFTDTSKVLLSYRVINRLNYECKNKKESIQTNRYERNITVQFFHVNVKQKDREISSLDGSFRKDVRNVLVSICLLTFDISNFNIRLSILLTGAHLGRGQGRGYGSQGRAF